MNALQESNEYNKIPEKNQSVNSLNYSYEKLIFIIKQVI